MPTSPRALLWTCGLGLLGAGCVSPPHAVGPTTFVGVVPMPGHPIAAAPAVGSGLGPLTLVDLQLSWTGGPDNRYQWQAVLTNESQTRLEVTVVFELLDAGNSTVVADQVSFELGGGDQHHLLREGTVTGPQRGAATRWQVEYWVRLLPPPQRRVRTSNN